KKDGWFVGLENPETRETDRDEHEPKNKEESKEKATSDSAKTDDTPRFQILAVGDEKVYLADHETKLKKLVKAGDKFGEFVVKEITDKDGWVVLLEKPGTKETIRIEEKKEKSKEEKESKEKGSPVKEIKDKDGK